MSCPPTPARTSRDSSWIEACGRFRISSSSLPRLTSVTFGWSCPSVVWCSRSCLYFVRHRHGAAAGLVSGAFTVALLSFVPGLGRWLFAGWMGLGLILGRVTTPVLLGVVWLILFAPLGMAFRVLGRDTMKRPFPSSEASFWEPHTATRTVGRYFQQF